MTTRQTILAAIGAAPLAIALGVAPAIAQDAADDAPSVEGDVIETAQGPLTIYPISHASLVLTWGDEAVYVDPVLEADLYASLPAPTAILITHEHEDHYAPDLIAEIGAGVALYTNPAVFDMLPEELAASATSIANGEAVEIGAIGVEAIPAYNLTEDRLEYHPEGRDNGYVLTFDDTRVLIAGDTEDTPEMRGLTDIDVAFVPMNLPFTMTVEQAADAVNDFAPAIVYPYHYGESDLDAFAALVADGIEVRIRDWYALGSPF